MATTTARRAARASAPLLAVLIGLAAGAARAADAGAPSPADLDAFFHFAAGTSEQLDPALRTSLAAGVVDFRAVLAGRRPPHAKADDSDPIPAEGGTKSYAGDGYDVIIVKSLARVAGIDGYMYGAVLLLGTKLALGSDPSVREVSFYPAASLLKLLGG